MTWSEEYWQSVKSFDTEEKLDLYFYRAFGFLIAKTAKRLRLTPDHLTYAGAVLGLASGFFFARPASTPYLIVASALLIGAGIFDSSDGQLARMGGGKGSPFGLILDGLCDNVVFTAVYAGSIVGLQGWGPEIWGIGLVAGLMHSLESSALDYYNREYLYFGYGKVNADYWNLNDDEARQQVADSSSAVERFLMGMRLSWIWQQNRLSTRSRATRAEWRALVHGPRSAEFQAAYRDHNRLLLRVWRLMGPNFHTIMILIFTFQRHFDYYLIGVDILFLPLVLLALRVVQTRVDTHFKETLKARGLG